MTEEKKDFYEIKKESVKQFLIVVGGAFVGCFLAILLAGQLVKPKFHHPCHCRIMPPPAYAHMKKFPPRHHCAKAFKKIEHKKCTEFKKIREQKQNVDVKTPVKVN